MAAEYRFKATSMIAESFRSINLRFTVENSIQAEHLNVSLPIQCGPTVEAHYISSDNDNDVRFRIFSLIPSVPPGNRTGILEICNELDGRIPYLKLYLDDSGNVSMDYDFPQGISDDTLGDIAVEILGQSKLILDENYGLLMDALCSEDEDSFSVAELRLVLGDDLEDADDDLSDNDDPLEDDRKLPFYLKRITDDFFP